MQHQPPRWANCLLEAFCAPHLLEEVQGDLLELYGEWRREYGERRAGWLYLWHVIKFFRPFVLENNQSKYSPNPTYMFRNYVTIALRNLTKYKGFSFINIVGLAIGLASFILITLYIYHELSVDRYHQNADNIYRITEDLRTENELLFQSTSSPPMGPAFAREYPEVLDFVRLSSEEIVVRKGDIQFYEEHALLADSSIFRVFDFPLLKGDAHSALVAPASVVLTETTARKYFGNEDPMGQTLIINGGYYNETSFMVTGVVADVPENSHFTFDLLLSFTTFTSAMEEGWIGGAWFWNGFHTYLLLAEGEDNVAKLKSRMPDFIAKYIGTKEQGLKMYYDDLPLQPLTSIYLATPRAWENGERGSKSNIYILAIIAVFILLIASFNYVNLATARASRRVKEVGLRKVLGAQRRALVQQFLGESIIISVLSMLLGLALAVLLLPSFNHLLETSLSLTLINNWYFWSGLVGLSLVLGMMAGAYPAFLVSGFHPLLIFRHAPQSLYGHAWLRKVLVAGQFVISITLVAGTLLVFDQLALVSNLNLGFDKDRTLTVYFNGDQDIQERLASVKNELRNVPGVVAVSAASNAPGATISNRFSSVETATGMSETNINTYLVDDDFIPDYDIEIVAGRTFSPDFPADDSAAFMINETAAKALGYQVPNEAVGVRVAQGDKEGTVIGVVNDFHYKSLHHQVEPLLLHQDRYSLNMLSLKIVSYDIPAVVAAVEQRWNSLAPHLPFLSSFLDQDYDRLYKAETQLSKVVTVFSGLAILVACLGLLGLTAFSVERRVKEIGIRKVLGASVKNLVLLISHEFFGLIVVAVVIAIPITYYVMNLWLESFTTRISISPLAFVVAGVMTLVVAGLAISYLSVKAAQRNPVDSLRNE